MNNYVVYLKNQIEITKSKIKHKTIELEALNELLIEYEEELREKEDYQRLEGDE